jgi:hypothetical protein
MDSIIRLREKTVKIEACIKLAVLKTGVHLYGSG